MTYTPEEQLEHRKRWVEALRSGRYQQGRAVLKDRAGAMCCLGVACDISGLATWSPIVDTDGVLYGYAPVIDTTEAGRFYAPEPVMEWLGLANNAGSFEDDDRKECLADLNDGGSPFEAIAKVIESEPPGLIAAPPTP